MKATVPNPDGIQATAAYLLTHAFAMREHAENDENFAGFQPEQYQQLKCLQAFIVKVKHAAIRREAPCAFRLLAGAGLELRFFMFFADDYLAARNSGPLPALSHMIMLQHAFRRFQVNGDASRVLVADMFALEFGLRAMLDTHPDCLGAGACRFEIPSVLVSSRYDLLAIRNAPDINAAAGRPGARRYVLCQRSADMAATRLFELDALSAQVVHANAGVATSQELAAKLSLASATAWPVDVIDTVFATLREAGVRVAQA